MKYNTLTTVKCPKCDEDVQVGTVGPAGIIGKKACIKAHKAKKEKGRVQTLFQVSVKQVQASLLAAMSKGSDNSSSQAQQPATGPKGCELGRKLIAELRMAAEQLGEDIPIATESNKISVFGQATAEANCMGVMTEEVWETVNPVLDRFLGFRRPLVEIKLLVCHGERGIEGFCQYLTYLVKEKGIQGGLIEGKVKVLIDTINNMYAPDYFQQIIEFWQTKDLCKCTYHLHCLVLSTMKQAQELLRQA